MNIRTKLPAVLSAAAAAATLAVAVPTVAQAAPSSVLGYVQTENGAKLHTRPDVSFGQERWVAPGATVELECFANPSGQNSFFKLITGTGQDLWVKTIDVRAAGKVAECQ